MKLPHIITSELDAIAAMLKALSDTSRLRILQVLHEGEASVGEIVERTQLTQANVSKHLKLLKQVHLVALRKEGTQVFYRMSDPCVGELCLVICDAYLQLVRNNSQKVTRPNNPKKARKS